MLGHDRNDTKGIETEDLKCICHFSYSELLYYTVIITIIVGLANRISRWPATTLHF